MKKKGSLEEILPNILSMVLMKKIGWILKTSSWKFRDWL